MPYRLSPFLVLLLCLSACSDGHWHPDPASSDAKTLKIAVFGSTAGNDQNYSASHEGAELATNSKEFIAIKNSVTIDQRNDAESVDKAIEEARRIRDDPDVLAVVGHSYSGTTRAALPVYEQAGIPVIVTTATSPYVMYKFEEHGNWPSVERLESREAPYPRFRNAFRLIPSDVPSQVEAIEAATRKLLHFKQEDDDHPQSQPADNQPARKLKVMLICDMTKRNGADVYTRPICDSLQHDNGPSSIANYIARYKELDADTVDVWELITEIHAVMRSENEKHIVFVGYPEMARVMLEELQERSPGTKDQMSRYTFIMSEACLSNELLDFGAQIYVTSPFNPSKVLKCLGGLKDEARKKKIVASAEAYAYDAVIILSKAAGACRAKNQLGRECVLQYLQENADNLPGECEQYWIGNGERKAAPYYVYAGCGGELTQTWKIGPEHEIYDERPCQRQQATR